MILRIVSSTYHKDMPIEVTYGNIELYNEEDKDFITEGYLFDDEALTLIQEAKNHGITVQLVIDEYSGDGFADDSDLISSVTTTMRAKVE
jgi:hypothetical protein